MASDEQTLRETIRRDIERTLVYAVQRAMEPARADVAPDTVGAIVSDAMRALDLPWSRIVDGEATADDAVREIVGEDRMLITVPTIEACTWCNERFSEDEQRAFDPEDNDHCPKCGRRNCLTTYYGDPSLEIRGGDLDAEYPGEKIAAVLRKRDEETALLREALRTARLQLGARCAEVIADGTRVDDGCESETDAPITVDEVRALRDAATAGDWPSIRVGSNGDGSPRSAEVQVCAGHERDATAVFLIQGDGSDEWRANVRLAAAAPRVAALAIAKAEEADALRAALDRLTADALASTKGDVVAEARALDEARVPDAVVHHGLDTPTRVRFYEHDFYPLSNFSAFRLLWKGWTFATSEHAYHWEKFSDSPPLQYEILIAPSAHEAFKLAEQHKADRREDWDAVKVGVMRRILRAKVEQHEYVRRKLLATGDRELVEDSWRDAFWGWGPNRDGMNQLGKLWMELRAELRSSEVRR